MNLSLLNADAPEDVWVDPNGHTGGPEHNLGADFSRTATWSTDDPENPYLTVDVTAYTTGNIVTVSEGEFTVAEAEHSTKTLNLPVTTSLPMDDGTYLELFENLCTISTYHTDLNDPSGSEVSSDYEYEEIGSIFQPSLETSEAFCKNFIQSIDFERDFF